MHYFEVWVSSQRYHSNKPLTYSYDADVGVGSIVIVPLQRQTVVGLVSKKLAKEPAFQTKSILGLVETSPAPQQTLQLIEWLTHYYPAPSGQIVSLFLPTALSSKSRRPSAIHDTVTKKDFITLPPLTEEQVQAVERIRENSAKSILLHGDTGTGKTRIYMELAKKSLAKNRSVILLTPEIGLTPQLVVAFQEAFPEQTFVIHSELTAAAKRDTWLQILQSDRPLVVIGPRSALFTPIKNIGLVIVDEFHEPSYKQEQAPHYLATRVGAKLAELHGAQLILGSATPLVSDYYAFKEKNLPIVRMTKQALQRDFTEPKVEIVDLKDKQLFSRSPWISNSLLEAIRQSLQNQQQSLVFLNRRGTARLILCQVCGWQAFCPNCDLPLTYHGDAHNMQCHTCGHTEKTPSSCMNCSANNIVFRNVGTKSIMAEVQRLIPNARVKRFDSDTAKPDRLEQQYTSVKEGDVDILVGTQMLGKGLDLPKLSVVGIITAETSLTFPDYTAEERTYQLVTQAIGRVNRGHVPGTAIVQTYQPSSLLLQAAASKNFEAFYQQQTAERKIYKFPPFRHLLKLSCTRATSASAKRISTQLAEKLRTGGRPIEIIGPNPAFAEKTHGKYHWQIIVKATRRQVLIDVINDLPANWSYDIDPMNLL